jgi:PelA/Pel-15E family pectate lyase
MQSCSKNETLEGRSKEAMLKATQFMVDSVSYNGGYLWSYLPDFSRQWGEMEANKTMIWMQHPGTISMGQTFLDAYHATGNEYYYQAAQKTAAAIIWGQSNEGGWNYVVDFAGDKSLKKWYDTVGKNGWRLEEFQHYYGNSTFDDDVTSDAARFLLWMYLEKLDPVYKPSLDKAIDFILKSQYPLGGWPQRYPLMHGFCKNGHPDYSSFYTFNDDVTWENVHFLIQCYLTLGEPRFLDPIKRGMEFYLTSQDKCGAWGQQLDMDLNVAGARTYEPACFLPATTFGNAKLLLKFYQYTGDDRFLNAVPKAIKWLESVKLPAPQAEGRRAYPTFVDPKTQKAVYVHRKGANSAYGEYYTDENDKNLLSHYYGKAHVNLDELKAEYNRVKNMSKEELLKDSPLTVGCFNETNTTPQRFYAKNRYKHFFEVNETKVNEVINTLDSKNRWLQKHAYTSHPYICDGKDSSATTKYSTTRVGDETDTSPYRDESDQEYISTSLYIRNMNILIHYLEEK